MAAGFSSSLFGFSQGRFLSTFAEYDATWSMDPRFLIGATLFIIGIGINWQSDNILFSLRKNSPATKDGKHRYSIPHVSRVTTCSY